MIMLQLLLLLVCIFSAIILLFLCRVVIVLRTIQSNRRHATSSSSASSPKSPQQSPHHLPSLLFPHPPLRTLIVLGSGGHTSEILYMTQYLNHPSPLHDSLDKNDDQSGRTVGAPAPLQFDPIFYCKASTDSTSHDRLSHYLMKDPSSDSNAKKPTEIYNIPRSREVGQSYLTSIYTTLVAILYSLQLVYTLRPNVILCNGPGTCIPICAITLLYRFLNILPNHQTYIVFIESFCRVQTLSLSGKLLHPVADLFIVHWKELHEQYPNSILTNTYI